MRKKSEGSRDATAYMATVKPPIVARKGSDHSVSFYFLKRIGETPIAPILNLSDFGYDFKGTLLVSSAEVLNEVELDPQGSTSRTSIISPQACYCEFKGRLVSQSAIDHLDTVLAFHSWLELVESVEGKKSGISLHGPVGRDRQTQGHLATSFGRTIVVDMRAVEDRSAEGHGPKAIREENASGLNVPIPDHFRHLEWHREFSCDDLPAVLLQGQVESVQ